MLLNEQRDLLPPDKIANLEAALSSMDSAIAAYAGPKAVTAEMDKLEKVANKNLIPYPSGTMRENVKEILVALVTIMAFTTFFLQLTKIPTGSMQPTLYGITDENLLDQNPAEKIPGFLTRVKDYWVWGIQYNWFVAPEDGEFNSRDVDPVQTVLPFIKRQSFKFNGRPYSIWFPGDGLFGPSETGHGNRAIVREGPVKKGEYVFAMKIIAGDHLLVDRMTYNFRHPERGEIIVFKTRGIQGLPQDQLYIKRLVGLPNEKIQIGDDQHLVVNGRRLTAADRHFEMVYSFNNKTDPVSASPAQDFQQTFMETLNHPPYRGHINQKIAVGVFHFPGLLAPLFPDANAVKQIRSDGYLPMGDNQLNSSDGRVFGDFDQKNLLGKCCFVYWPFTERFGWAYR